VTTPKTLDPDLLIRNLDGDSALLARVVALFFETTDPILSSLRADAAAGDAEAVARSAHALRGALANVGAEAGAHEARRLETLARRGALDDARAALVVLENELARLRPALERLAARAEGA